MMTIYLIIVNFVDVMLSVLKLTILLIFSFMRDCLDVKYL